MALSRRRPHATYDLHREDIETNRIRDVDQSPVDSRGARFPAADMEVGDAVGRDELPPPTDPTLGKKIDMVAFRQAIKEAGVKDFFQKVCSDILLQRPDDVFSFTARKFRAEARLIHSRRVAQEQKERLKRREQLKNLALEKQQVDIRRLMEKELNGRNQGQEGVAVSPNSKAAQQARKRFFVGRGGGGGPVRPPSPLAEWNRKRMVGIALSPDALRENFLAHYRLSTSEVTELFALCKAASVDGGRTVGTTSFTASMCNTTISYVGGRGRMDEDVAVRLFKCLSWAGQRKDQLVDQPTFCSPVQLLLCLTFPNRFTRDVSVSDHLPSVVAYGSIAYPVARCKG